MRKRKTIRREIVGETWPPKPVKSFPRSMQFLDAAKKYGVKTQRP